MEGKKRENKIGSKSTVSISPNFALRRKICKSPVRQSEIRGNSRPSKKKKEKRKEEEEEEEEEEGKEKDEIEGKRDVWGCANFKSKNGFLKRSKHTFFFANCWGWGGQGGVEREENNGRLEEKNKRNIRTSRPGMEKPKKAKKNEHWFHFAKKMKGKKKTSTDTNTCK